MTDSTETISCDLAVIGAGMAGMASALFAANRGLSVVQAGVTGEVLFASGFFDLAGTEPGGNPWDGIERLVRESPLHPYGRIPRESIRTALSEYFQFVEQGFPYAGYADRNCDMVTSLGTVKTTWRVPRTMWPGVEALTRKTRCLLVDFRSLRGFSAAQIAAVLRKEWPGLETARIEFPGAESVYDLYPEHMARALEVPANREKLARSIEPFLGKNAAVGMPAVFGIDNPGRVADDLSQKLGVPVFEIPTLPPSVPGLRLKEAFERRLPEKGVRQFLQHRVVEARALPEETFLLRLEGRESLPQVHAAGVILATGRFFGRGLIADRKGIRESLFGLPVRQPEKRSGWHREDFFDVNGHPVNRAGLDVDASFRPLASGGPPAFPTLFAAGSILAHQDWIRMKCGSGLAVATAHAAVEAFCNLRRKRD